MDFAAGCAGGHIKERTRGAIVDSDVLLDVRTPVRRMKVRLEDGRMYEWTENYYGTTLTAKLSKDGKVIWEEKGAL